MADTFCLSSSFFKRNVNIQLITYTILHDISLICSIIISYPLYFSYFIYFSRYLIKLFSFISPLFFTTVFLSLLLTSFCSNFPYPKLEILQTVINELKLNIDDVEGFEIYEIVFDGTLVCNVGVEEVMSLTTKMVIEHSVDRTSCLDLDDDDDHAVNYSDSDKLCVEKVLESYVHGGWRMYDMINDSYTDKLCLEKTLERSDLDGLRYDNVVQDTDKLKNDEGVEKLMEELDGFEDFTTATETETDLDEVVVEFGKANAGPVRRVVSYNDKQIKNTVGSSSWRLNSSSNFKSYGSMKEEKEWRRTLACKLFEERYNSEGGEEGMDSLWEDYETDNEKNQKEIMSNNNNGGVESFNDVEEDEDDNNEGEEMSNGHLCCLQALKFSTRKMSLGMGRPNLMKISKALKGFGWLHQVKNKHGKTSLGSFMG